MDGLDKPGNMLCRNVLTLNSTVNLSGFEKSL